MNFRFYFRAFSLLLIVSMMILTTSSSYAQDNKGDCEVEVSKKSDKLRKKAIDELRLGHYAAATNILQDAIDNSPENLKALWILADINRRPTNRNRVLSIAKESYQQIIDICPSYENYYSYFYLGGIYYQQQEYEKAYKMYRHS